MEKLLSALGPKKSPLLGFSDTLGDTLLTDAQNKWDKTQILKVTIQSSEGLLLRCRVWFPGKELHGASLAVQSEPCLYKGLLQKTTAECYFHFSPFFIRVKILFGLILVSKPKQTNKKQPSSVMHSFEKQGISAFKDSSSFCFQRWFINAVYRKYMTCMEQVIAANWINTETEAQIFHVSPWGTLHLGLDSWSVDARIQGSVSKCGYRLQALDQLSYTSL